MGKLELLIVAWDGAPPELVSRLVRQGTLPVLRDILGPSGIRRIHSTIPPITATAWASFHLGVNPGKHGILDFLYRRPGEPSRLVSSRDFPYPTFWEILAEEIPVGAVGFPLGYPALALARGFWLPGFLAPADATSVPREALAMARDAGYAFNPPSWFPGRGWVEELKGRVKAKTAASLALARRYKPLMLGIHYQETDTVQHFLWGRPEVEEVFAAADEGLGTLLEELSPRNVLLLSDHGMGPVRWDFHLNTWLLREGFLVLRTKPAVRLRKRLFEAGFSPRSFQGLGERIASLLGTVFPRPGMESMWRHPDLGTLLFLSLRDVEWKETSVYAPGGMGALAFNGRARVDPDIVMRRLRELRTPEGLPLVEEIFTREELYWGPKVQRMPHLLFLTRKMEVLPVSSTLFLYHHPFSLPSVPGHHRMEGFVASHGALAFEEETPIWAIAPAILAYFGKTPPDHMDKPA